MAFWGYSRKLKQLRAQNDELIRLSKEEKSISIINFIDTHLYKNPRYQGNKRLNIFEEQTFSQFGEDGIIREIFNRIGTTNKYFVEFGVESGLECNSTALLYKGWSGLWIEGSPEYSRKINEMFADMIGEGKLKLTNAFITRENIESLFKAADIPTEPDMMSIDIDSNDYYVWEAMVNYSPRVVIVEYNSTFAADTYFRIPYKPDRVWDGTSYFGSSLLALQTLADAKGYSLVGCNFGGNNAFFVRNDVIGDKFESPYTAANHYEPARNFLQHRPGHPTNKLPA